MTLEATETREMVGGGKPKRVRPSRAKAATVLPKADAQAAADRMARLEALVGNLAENTTKAVDGIKASVDALSAKVAGVQAVATAASKIPTTGSPEANLGAFMKDMKQGEQRDGIRKQEVLNDPTSDEIIPSRSIVALKPETQKYQAIAKVMKLPEGQPVYGQVLQYLGRKTLPNGKRLGERKYKIHLDGVGRDGVMESEITLVKVA